MAYPFVTYNASTVGAVLQRSKSMSRFDTYRDSFPNARLARSTTGVLEVALHTNGGTLVFNGHTHEQFVDLFHAISIFPHFTGDAR